MNEIMQQIQKVQGDLQQAQEQLSTLEIKGEAGAGLVKVVMTGKYDVKRLDIDPSLMQEDVTVLEDIVSAAINSCVKQVESEVAKTMKGATNLPFGFKPPV